MYRVASVTVADYWRAHYKHTNGLDCGSCSKVQRAKCRQNWLYSECPKAIKLEYLSQPITDSEGNLTELIEFIADDNAVDIVARLEARRFLQGFPSKAVRIGYKIYSGIPLDAKEKMYISRFRKQTQKPLF